MIPIFQRLSKKIGKEKVIWRYNPILFTDVYTEEYHRKAFSQIAEALNGYTEKCVIGRSEPDPLPICTGAYSQFCMKYPAKVKHVLITQPKTDFLNGQKGRAEQRAGEVHF